jgi:hypothetical protein
MWTLSAFALEPVCWCAYPQLLVVASACTELQTLRDRWAVDTAWMNEAITMQEEPTTLVSLLVDGLMGE